MWSVSLDRRDCWIQIVSASGVEVVTADKVVAENLQGFEPRTGLTKFATKFLHLGVDRNLLVPDPD